MSQSQTQLIRQHLEDDHAITDIPGYVGRYGATRDGRIWSYPKNGGCKNGKFLKPYIDKLGYKKVGMGGGSTRSVHRLVAFTIPNPKDKPVINHKDGNPSNNKIENLEWATVSENTLHGWRALGRVHHRPNKEKFGLQSKSSIQVAALNKDNEVVFVLESCGLAVNYGLIPTHISACCKGRRKTHSGYRWKHITREEYHDLRNQGLDIITRKITRNGKTFASYSIDTK